MPPTRVATILPTWGKEATGPASVDAVNQSNTMDNMFLIGQLFHLMTESHREASMEVDEEVVGTHVGFPRSQPPWTTVTARINWNLNSRAPYGPLLTKTGLPHPSVNQFKLLKIISGYSTHII